MTEESSIEHRTEVSLTCSSTQGKMPVMESTSFGDKSGTPESAREMVRWGAGVSRGA